MTTQITEEWVSLWYQCLTQNIDYSLYCNARQSGDESTAKRLEKQFSKIAEIYEDFGMLDGWPDDGTADKDWKAWFAARRHLFIQEPITVSTPDSYNAKPGYVLVEIPLHEQHSSTLKSLSTFLDALYCDPHIQKALHPKYSLHLKGDRVAHGLKQVRSACASVVRSYRYDLASGEELNFDDAVIQFIKHEIDNMGWSLDERARKDLQERDIPPADRLDSFKAQLTRCRRDFRAFARNTIRGRFPDDSDFDSNVLDIF